MIATMPRVQGIVKDAPAKKTYLKRDLKYFKWSSTGEKGKIPDLVLYNKKTGVVFPIPKVYAMSLHKFIPNYLDNIRIIQNKNWRERLRKIQGKFRERLNAKRIKAQARKVK